MFKTSQTGQRLRGLEQHLKQENPLLAEVIGSFKQLDHISRRLGFFGREDSHATRTPWWPLISVLGLYSSGKSSFINHYLQYDLQATGNQAVDDKFTVICFSGDKKVRVLPALALDADLRFPLYKISRAIEEVAAGHGGNIEAYLQLKTCSSAKLRGRIFIDSPGFDADAQRSATLRITDHIMDLSDLVLVFFDARHPESGSMRDTLEHLVSRTATRRDSNKFLYILNQIDTTAKEDNPEEVFAAWQRALAQYGLTAGSCYAVYNPEVAVPIENESLRRRFERKRDADMAAINNRIEQVGMQRAYRIVGMLEQNTKMVAGELVPRLQRFVTGWRRRILWLDGLLLALVLGAFLAITIWAGYWQGLTLRLPFWNRMAGGTYTKTIGLLIIWGIAGYVHFAVRRWSAGQTTRKLLAEIKDEDLRPCYLRAFKKNSRWYRTLFNLRPAGWGKRSQILLAKLQEDASAYIQRLNDLYTNPSGTDTDDKHPRAVPDADAAIQEPGASPRDNF